LPEIPPRVRRWLDRFPTTDLPKAAAGAAVMIVLREGAQDVEVLLIERSLRDGDLASGHVALPGGHFEPTDPTMRSTALRELAEEVGIAESGLVGSSRLVGTELAPLFGLNVAVYAAALGPSAGPVAADPKEVAHVFWLPVGALGRVEKVSRETRVGMLEVPAVVHDGHVLWGFTLKVLNRFFGEGQGPAEPEGAPALPGAGPSQE
jgi:8-oxo-dGTP pyrophosphatase MutT (NUDIX family)